MIGFTPRGRARPAEPPFSPGRPAPSRQLRVTCRLVSPPRARAFRWFSVRRNGFHVHDAAFVLRHGRIWRSLQLVPQAGRAFEAVTEFDGSAIFESLPVGAYQLQLEPRQAETLRMRLLSSPAVAIKGDGGFTPDVVVQVRFDPPGVTVAATGGG